MRKICKTIHLWLALPVGLVFSLICFTGAILVFEQEITDAVYSCRSKITEAGLTPMDIEHLEAAILLQLPEGSEVRSITESQEADKAYKVSLTNPRGAAYFVNQYTGEIVGDCGRIKFFLETQALHRWLLCRPSEGKSLGKTIVGWCVVASLFIMITGLVLWWPRSSKAVTSRFSVRFKPLSAFWYSLHVVGGFYVFIIVLLMILTGLFWSFSWYREVFLTVVGHIPVRAIHTGAFLGIFSKIIWFIATLIGGTLPLTGYYLYFHRKIHKH